MNMNRLEKLESTILEMSDMFDSSNNLKDISNNLPNIEELHENINKLFTLESDFFDQIHKKSSLKNKPKLSINLKHFAWHFSGL